MYKQLLLVSSLSLGLAAAPAVMAKPDNGVRYNPGHDRVQVVDHRDVRDHDRDDHRDDRRDDRHDDHHDRNDRHDDNNWRSAHDRRDDAHERQWHDTRYRVAPYRAPRGYSHRAWHRGERLPSGYRASRYVVHDYRSYRLYNPPRGHQWVRVDRDVVLTAVATGVVAAVVYNIFS